MAKLLWHGSYSERGAKALVSEGGTERRAGVEQAVAGVGGTLETAASRAHEDQGPGAR